MTDYTNGRWHVDGAGVTHDDFPEVVWTFRGGRATTQLAEDTHMSPGTHAARAWLAAQPKPTIKKGMRIEATLRGGAVLTGEVTRVNECVNLTMVNIGSGITCYTDVKHYADDAMDITAWHEVTA